MTEPLPPPVPGFTPAPLPGPGSFNSIVTVDTVDALLADNANHGNAVAPNVHIIDVRSSFEYLADVCPGDFQLVPSISPGISGTVWASYPDYTDGPPPKQNYYGNP